MQRTRRSIQIRKRLSPARYARPGNGKSSSSNRRSSADAVARMAGLGGGGASTAWRPTTNSGSAALRREEPESARIARYERDLRNLGHLREFALPIIDALAQWPEHDNWGNWLERLSALAVRALRRPARVLQTLADLRPMAEVGPVTVEEARDVLHDRLVMLDWEPPARRYGRLFVGTPHQARGRAFRVVFVPGLAERIVPQRPREDPLLLDGRRRALDAALVRQEARGSAERLLLKISIGRRRSDCICRTRGWTLPRRARACRRSTRST